MSSISLGRTFLVLVFLRMQCCLVQMKEKLLSIVRTCLFEWWIIFLYSNHFVNVVNLVIYIRMQCCLVQMKLHFHIYIYIWKCSFFIFQIWFRS